MSTPVPKKIAILGPEHSFSHELATTAFRGAKVAFCKTFTQAIKMVVNGKADLALLPFYNTNERSVPEAQTELIKFRGKIFVTDVLSHVVHHSIGGFCESVAGVRHIWTKAPVFSQVSVWVGRNLPRAKHKSIASTSAAIKDIAAKRPKGTVAIGTKSAFSFYGVPILADEIQNNPNKTLFFVLEKRCPAIIDSDRVLMILDGDDDDELSKIEDLAEAARIELTSGWRLIPVGGGATHYFFELDGRHVNMDLQAAVTRIANDLPNAFFVGGYRQKCIAQMMAG